MRFERLFTVGLAVVVAAVFLWMAWLHQTQLAPIGMAADGTGPQALKAPDLVPLGAAASDIIAWQQAMDMPMRSLFISTHTLKLDLVFPILLGWLLYRLFGHVMDGFARFQAQPRLARIGFKLVMVIPYVLADFAENFAVLDLLSSLAPDPALAGLIGSLTLLKFVSVTVPVLVLGAMAYVQWRRQPRARA